MNSILQKIVDSRRSDSPSHMFRKKRFKVFLDMLNSFGGRPVTILDVGGTESYWEMQGFIGTGHSIVLLNTMELTIRYPGFTAIVGDARDLSQFKDKAFDIVFSNSVIEHVGSYTDQQLMAQELRRVGKRIYVQTPNFYFFIEPHFLFPFFHWLPVVARVFLVRNFSLGWFEKMSTRSEALRAVTEIRLLTKSELRRLFPNTRIVKEKVFGLTKSYIVLDDAAPADAVATY